MHAFHYGRYVNLARLYFIAHRVMFYDNSTDDGKSGRRDSMRETIA